jgi:hypothetical protein
MSTHTDQAKLDFAISLFLHAAQPCTKSGAYNISTSATGSAYAKYLKAATLIDD